MQFKDILAYELWPKCISHHSLEIRCRVELIEVPRDVLTSACSRTVAAGETSAPSAIPRPAADMGPRSGIVPDSLPCGVPFPEVPRHPASSGGAGIFVTGRPLAQHRRVRGDRYLDRGRTSLRQAGSEADASRGAGV